MVQPNCPNELQCPMCQFLGKDKKGLQHHINAQHSTQEKQTHMCRFCGKCYIMTWALEQHETKVHGAGPAAVRNAHVVEPQHGCIYCGKEFVLKGARNHHEKANCPRRPGSGATVCTDGTLEFRCVRCHLPFKSTKARTVHMNAKHQT